MIKYIQPPPVSSSQGKVAEMYKQIRRDFGLVGDTFIIHSLSVPLLAGFWACIRETELAGSIPREIKEAVAVAVSQINRCSFCVDAHSTMLMAAGNNEAARKIINDEADEIRDEKMKSIVKWALATRSPRSSILLNPPFTPQEAPEIIGTAVINHYINRIMDILTTNKSIVPTDNALLRKFLNRGIALIFSSSVRKMKIPGDSLRFLPEAPLPDDLHWAKTNPVIRRAFACMAAAADRAGERVLTEEARSVVKHCIDAWDGKEPGLSRNWTEQHTSMLTGPSKIATKLSLLAAIAPHQIDDELVRDYQSVYKEDVQLLNVVSWSSFTAVRKIGTWLSVWSDQALIG